MYAINGSGIKIGVISDGTDSLSLMQKMGELPSDVTVLSNKNGGDEGTKMLQIIHDIAPGAQLFFHDSGVSPQEFNEAINALLIEGCQIICDDVNWIADPVFEDGETVTYFQKNNQQSRSFIRVSAAGNLGSQHYRALYYKGEDNYHDFSLGKNSTKDILIDVPFMGKVIAVLKWDEKSGSSKEDYDLFITRVSDAEVLQSGQIRQNGTGIPLEYARWININPGTERVAIKIQNHEGTATPKELDLILVVSAGITVLPYNIIPEHSIFGHTASPGVISVAAVPADNTEKIEPFSSAGSVNILFPVNITRNKPDVTGPDNVVVLDSTGKPDSFSGTSAAAPHVAGVLALLWGAFPKKSADEIRESVIKTATDLGPSGWDERFGYGLVNATAAIESLGIIDKTQSQIKKENFTPNSTLLRNIPVKPEYFPDGFIKVAGPLNIDKPGNYRISRDILQNGRIFPLFINCSDVTLDGDGHTISGVILGDAKPRFQTGLFIHNTNRMISNITIKNLQFRDFDTGMLIGLSRDILVENCSFIGNFIGLSDYQSKNITIQGSLLTGNDGGIVELSSVNSNLQGNILKGNKDGLNCLYSQNATIVNNSFIMNTRDGAYIYNSIRVAIVGNSFLKNSEYGLLLINVSEKGISGNIFSENFEGICVSISRRLEIKGNLIENNTGDGAGIYESKNIALDNNIIYNNNHGVQNVEGKEIFIRKNSIFENKQIGVFVDGSLNVTIAENSIRGSDNGLILSYSDKNSLTSNEIINNDIGIFIDNSKGNIFQNNVLKNNKNIVINPFELTYSLNGTLYSGNR